MKRRRIIPGLVAVLALAACGSVAQAQITTFTSEAAFLAALAPGYYTNSFTGLNGGSDGSLSSPQMFASAPFTYDVAAASGSLYTFQSTSPKQLTTNNANTAMTITMTSGNVTAVGAYFYITTSGPPPVFQTQLVSLTLNYVGGSQGNSFTPTSIGTSFFGYISNGPKINSLTMNAPGSNFNSMSTLTVGINAATVPEPSTFILGGVLVGGGLVGWRVRKAKTRKTTVA